LNYYCNLGSFPKFAKNNCKLFAYYLRNLFSYTHFPGRKDEKYAKFAAFRPVAFSALWAIPTLSL
jgi:hypothetical protein